MVSPGTVIYIECNIDIIQVDCEPAMRRRRADGGEDERVGYRPGDGSEANGRVSVTRPGRSALIFAAIREV